MGLSSGGTGSKDGLGSSDHDVPYTFGVIHPRSNWPYPFTDREYARLLVLRSHVQEKAYISQLERRANARIGRV